MTGTDLTGQSSTRAARIFAARHFLGCHSQKPRRPSAYCPYVPFVVLIKSMLDPQKISLFRVRQAYRLNSHESEMLLHALSPGNVFPFAFWQKAYTTFWKGPSIDNARLYHCETPQFPTEGELPENHFPVQTYATWITTFIVELAGLIPCADFFKGLDFVIENTIEEENFEFKPHKENMEALLRIDEKHFYQQGHTDISRKAQHHGHRRYDFIADSFPDTVAVDKIAAIHYLSVIQGYPFHQEVKGITRALVESVIKAVQEGTLQIPCLNPIQKESIGAAIQSPEQQGMTLIPRALWEGKKPQQVCDDMRVAGFEEDAPIAYALYYWVGVKNFTEIGTILRGDGITNSARDKHARKHFKLAEGRYYTE